MKYLSVCSGIEAATVAWHHMGWSPVGFSEIEKFPAQVLAHHYPNTTNFGDLTKHDTWNIAPGTVDLLVGGTPCQAFSVAGLRRGMDDARGQLTLEFVRLAARLRPQWIVWENVPGVLSSGGGRDFGSFLGALGELGYGWAYRILDAQYFGVAQRRRRVFVVGYLGDWRCAAAVLFERESLRGNPPPRRESRQEVANCLGASPASSSCPNVGNGQGNVIGTLTARMGNNPMGAPEVDGGMYMPWPQVAGALDCRIGAQRAQNAQNGHMIPAWPAEVAPTLNAAFGTKQGLEDQHALGGAGCFVPALPVAFNSRQDPVQYGNQSGAVDTDGHTMAVALGTDCYNGSVTGDVAATMGTPGSSVNASGPTVMVAQPSVMQVRRLTPMECERLQGFPDGYTDIRPRGKDTPDGPRYKALGNSMAVPVMRWIGERVNLVDSLKRSR
jgi:DNA (cytosine-5)-methyltransferase 1